MTDRYYPKSYLPDAGPLQTTYNEMNQMTTHDRSKFPPGYCGHEHGTGLKFGYSIPAPNELPNPPIDPEHPLVMFRLGKKYEYQPLPCAKLRLQKASTPEPRFQVTFREGDTQKASITSEGPLFNTFTPQTSAYLAHRTPVEHGDRGAKVDKHGPYTPAIFGQGTGFNSDSPYISWLPPGALDGKSTFKDHYPPPKIVRRGLAVLGMHAVLAGKCPVCQGAVGQCDCTRRREAERTMLQGTTEYRDMYNHLGENISYTNR